MPRAQEIIILLIVRKVIKMQIITEVLGIASVF